MSMGERAVEEREMDHSPESMPPLEDMSHVPVLASRAGYSQQNTFTSSQDEFNHQTAFHQTFNDQRTVNVDQRQVHMTQHHVHGPDPSLIGNLAASAATSAVRAEATEAVAQAREVAHAVASDLRVSQARESFMDLELRNLRAQVEALRHENAELRSSRNAALAAAPDSASGQNPNNGSELEQRVREMELHIVSGITPRIDYLEQVAMMIGNIESSISQRITPHLQSLETRLLQVQQQLDHHQTFIQELWAGQPQGSRNPGCRYQLRREIPLKQTMSCPQLSVIPQFILGLTPKMMVVIMIRRVNGKCQTL